MDQCYISITKINDMKLSLKKKPDLIPGWFYVLVICEKTHKCATLYIKHCRKVTF